MSDSNPVDRDPDETFRTTVEAVERWHSRNADATVRSVPHALRRTLDRELNGDSKSQWERDVVESPTGQHTCDVVVNGAIGVKVVRDLNINSTSEFHQGLRVLGERYTHLLLLAYRLPRDDIDLWRVATGGIQARDVGVDQFVALASFEQSSGRSEAERTGRLSRAFTAGPEAVALLVGVGLVAALVWKLFGWLPAVGVEMRSFFIMLAVLYAGALLFGVVYLRILS